MIEETIFYTQQLSLTKSSITEIADSFGISFKEIQEKVIKTDFLFGLLEISGKWQGMNILKEGIKIITPAVINELTTILVKYLSAQFTAQCIEETLKIILPGIGSLIGAAMSFGTTYFSLKKILDDLEETLINIMDYCQQHRSK